MDDLKKFENREDDWLAKQRRLESRISPWDLDDARKLKNEHEKIHSDYNRRKYSASVNRKGSGFAVNHGHYHGFIHHDVYCDHD